MSRSNFPTALAVAICIAVSPCYLFAGDDDLRLLRTLCMDCHGNEQAEANVNVERLMDDDAFATDFRHWRRVARMLEQHRMPPGDSEQPTERDRQRLVRAIRKRIAETAAKHAHDPGQIVMRRLTGAQFNHTVRDLTGLDLNLAEDFVGDAVGGAGFTNVGNVQFVQDSTLERCLTAARRVADHAVIGAGPLMFFQDPGATGFELAAISRIQQINRAHGFRIGAGEGGKAYGMDRYGRAFFAAWCYRHRQALGQPTWQIAEFARRENVDTRFVRHIWSVLTERPRSFPTSEIVDRWNRLPAPQGNPPAVEDVRQRCGELFDLVHDWQTNLGQNALDNEDTIVLAEDAFEVGTKRAFEINVRWPDGDSTVKVHLTVKPIHPPDRRPVVIWREPSVMFRNPDVIQDDPKPIRQYITGKAARAFRFGRHPSGATIGDNDFVTTGPIAMTIEVPVPAGAKSGRFYFAAEADLENGDDGVFRCTVYSTDHVMPGKSVTGLIANPADPAFAEWKAGVLEFARLLPQVSHREPVPSDRDPIPAPFDNLYNTAERNLFHYRIKYHRDDAFLVEHILDDATRERLDQAWADLLLSFEYHDAYLKFVARKFAVDLNGMDITGLDASTTRQFPADVQPIVSRLASQYRWANAKAAGAEAAHVDDVLAFAARAWRRPVTRDEETRLRRFYQQLRRGDAPDHREAIRSLIVRVMMSPSFLYHLEQPASDHDSVPLTDWQLASRLSFFLWSSVPDDTLREAAAAGELHRPEQLAQHARRMLRDARARRFAEEFFGQWLGFYRFDKHRGVDHNRFPEFSDDLKADMYQESVMFFDDLIRHDRPVGEILFADHAFLTRDLARHYGIPVALADGGFEREDGLERQDDSKRADSGFKRVDGVRRFDRGGLFGMGSVLTMTSAPRRTSPVKRGDWVLRRVLGTPVPPPPADAGSIAADEVAGDGLTVRGRLEAHRNNPSCRNCHSRIDPLGFTLEQFDAIGRRRSGYADGQPIDTSGRLADGTAISGVAGLRTYMKANAGLFHRTLCTKLAGFALGRRESICDVALIDRMIADLDGGRAPMSRLIEHIVTSRQFRFQRGNSARTQR